MFLGDFNADCSYVKQSDWASIRLRSSDVFKWLIPDSADSTVGKSDCAYDRWVLPWLHATGPHRGFRGSSAHCVLFSCRIVVCGAKLKRSIVPNSAAVYNFQHAFQLEQEEVSRDHQQDSVSAVHGAVWDSIAELPHMQQRQPGTTRLPVFGIRQPGPSHVAAALLSQHKRRVKQRRQPQVAQPWLQVQQRRHAALT